MVAQPHNARMNDDCQTSGTSRESDRIRSEIDGARQQLDGTIDELTQRLTPEQIMHRTIASCQRAAWNGAGRVAHLVKEHPLPAAMIGAGVLWLIRESLGSRTPSQYPSVAPPRGAFARMREKVADTASSTAEGIKNAGSTAAEAVASAGSGVKHAAQATGSYVGEVASAAGSSLSRGARQATHWTEHIVQDYPLATASACFALGLASGLALPRTRKEDDLLGETRDQFVQQVQSTGAGLLRKGEQVVERAAESVAAGVDQGSRALAGHDQKDESGE